MIDHVMRALRDSSELDGDVWVSGLDVSEIITDVPSDLTSFVKRLKNAPAGNDPAAAALANLEAGAELPMLITTCDHPLLTPEMISSFLQQSDTEVTDLSVGLAPRTVIEQGYPDVKRTYLTLAGQGYSGCNLFYVKTAKARKAIDFWRDVGRDRKHPLKIARRLGYRALFRVMTGRLGLKDAFSYGSDLVGADISPVLIPFAEAAIDVDKPSDLALVTKILEKQGKLQAVPGLRQ